MVSGTAFSNNPAITYTRAPALGSRLNDSAAPLNSLLKEPPGLLAAIHLFPITCNLSLDNMLFCRHLILPCLHGADVTTTTGNLLVSFFFFAMFFFSLLKQQLPHL